MIGGCYRDCRGDRSPQRTNSAWPQFRGPEGSGIAEEQKPPVEIGPDKNVKWKVAVPSGLSSPIVVGDKLVLTAFENDKLYTIAYNRADGSEAWRAEAPDKKIEPFNKAKAARPLRRARPTASGSFRTSVRAGCSATTWPARNCGSTRCRRR